jgi:hypothetical protein
MKTVPSGKLLRPGIQKELASAGKKRQGASRLFEIALVLVRFDHVARFIVNADHGIM